MVLQLTKVRPCHRFQIQKIDSSLLHLLHIIINHTHQISRCVFGVISILFVLYIIHIHYYIYIVYLFSFDLIGLILLLIIMCSYGGLLHNQLLNLFVIYMYTIWCYCEFHFMLLLVSIMLLSFIIVIPGYLHGPLFSQVSYLTVLSWK